MIYVWNPEASPRTHLPPNYKLSHVKPFNAPMRTDLPSVVTHLRGRQPNLSEAGETISIFSIDRPRFLENVPTVGTCTEFEVVLNNFTTAASLFNSTPAGYAPNPYAANLIEHLANCIRKGK